MANLQQIRVPDASQPVIDPRTGLMTTPWYQFLSQLSKFAVQGPTTAVTSGVTAKWDGTTGRLLKE